MSYSLAQIHGYVRKQREIFGENLLLLDNGDILQGEPSVYYYNFEVPDELHICSKMMNYMCYDAATIGNHDIEMGHDVYDRVRKEMNFPWMGANIVKKSDGTPYFTPYSVFERQGVRVAVLGMTTPSVPNWLPEKLWDGMEFQDLVESAQYWSDIIHQKEKPDVLIGLLHSGIDFTYNNQDENTAKNENASKLVAELIQGFDIVFAGHDHQNYNSLIANIFGETVLLMDCKSYARTLASVSISLRKNESSGSWVKHVSGELLEVSSWSPDAGFMEMFNLDFETIRAYVNQSIGRLTKTISSQEALFGASDFVDLLHSVQIELTKADISFVSPLSFRAKIKKGTIRVRDMFKLYRFENFLYTIWMFGHEIKDYLEYSYGVWYNQMKDEDDHLLNFKDLGTGSNYILNTAFYNYSSAAGICYEVDVTRSVGQRVVINSVGDGKTFDLEARYLVALNSYRGNGGGSHMTQGVGIDRYKLLERIVDSTDKDLRFCMTQWIRDKVEITPKVLGNWTVKPYEWWCKGKKRDAEILYGNRYSDSINP